MSRGKKKPVKLVGSGGKNYLATSERFFVSPGYLISYLTDVPLKLDRILNGNGETFPESDNFNIVLVIDNFIQELNISKG